MWVNVALARAVYGTVCAPHHNQRIFGAYDHCSHHVTSSGANVPCFLLLVTTLTATLDPRWPLLSLLQESLPNDKLESSEREMNMDFEGA